MTETSGGKYAGLLERLRNYSQYCDEDLEARRRCACVDDCACEEKVRKEAAEAIKSLEAERDALKKALDQATWRLDTCSAMMRADFPAEAQSIDKLVSENVKAFAQ